LKKSNTPKRKRLKRKNRLESAKKWINNYSGKNIVKGYANWYGVDLVCSIKELKMNGMMIKENYEKQLIRSKENKTSVKKIDDAKANKEYLENQGKYSDENFEFIAGYTSGGAPYGIAHKKTLEYENQEKLSFKILKRTKKT